MRATRSARYTGVAIALHWAMAALLVFMIWLGWNMDGNEARYQLHKSIGITLLFLTVTRIVWRWLNPPPAPADDMALIEKRASHFVHMAFYVLMIGIPLGGWLMVSLSPFKVPTVLYGTISWPNLPFVGAFAGETPYAIVEFMHSKAAWVLLGLLALHVAGALKHELSGEDGVLKRMIPALMGRTTGPVAPAKGFLPAFGLAAALFAVVAGVPLMSGSGAERTLQTTGMTGVIPNWDVDYEVSEIRFSGIHDGNAFSGVFENWQADVAFYPDNLGASEVRVEVDTGSAKTGKKLYDDSLRAAEWFNIADYPQATVTLDSFEAGESETAYTANATLRLKDQSVTTPLEFTLLREGTVATLDGTATFTRKSLDLGQDSDPGADWVAEDVTVRVTGKATYRAPQ